MTDREMLEYAAKAAGFIGQHWTRSDGTVCLYDGRVYFDPLLDDGDAFRLMVFLMTTEEPTIVNYDGDLGVREPCGTDPAAAYRRVITRAAAEIGRNMK